MTAPLVSIVTTVFDRIGCLEQCLRSVKHLRFQDYEHIVVSDAPGPEYEAAIDAAIALYGDGRTRHLRRRARANDWGRSPAIDAMRASTGRYVCFLSDDNAYLPEHFDPLVAALEADPDLGFAYSSCQYAGRRILAYVPPVGAGIDLGQPLFRRSVIRDLLHDDLPFYEFAWDWRLIHALMAHGVRYQHVEAATFIFRLAAYPQYVEALA
jgi:glycosyltransferase involved in cell wall biosynthesis